MAARAGFDAAMSSTTQAHGSSLLDLSGVGDAAYGYREGPQGFFQFVKGQTTVSVTLQATAEPAGFADGLTSLAHTVAGRV